MSFVYAVTFENVVVSVAQDFFELLAGDDRPVKLLYVEIGNLTELGDTAEEELRISIVRGHTASGSGGAAATSGKMLPNNPAAGCSAETNNTTIASAGSPINLYAGAWNIRQPFIWDCADKRQIGVNGADLLVVRLLAAPADAITMSGTLYYEESV